MCGIVGIIDKDNKADHLQLVKRMRDLLKHRGPDDLGFYKGKGCVLAQTRLSIIDLERGHQPLSNEDGTIWIAFNGEIYNYLELKQELITEGHRFSTNTDTEVIVHLYEDYGIKLLEKLNGMFAFALWEAKERILFLVRDHLGIKPLYYTIQNDKLIFASEMKALLVNQKISRKLDKEAIAEYLTLNYIPESKTPFENIRKLSRGSYIEYRNDKIKEKRYWCIPTENHHVPKSIDDLCEQMRFLIEDAIRLQLRADVPVGLFASGGLDSTTIMWGASRQNVSLQAFLVEFDELAADTPYARIASTTTGMKLIEEHLSYDKAGKLLPRLVWHLDEPLADSAIIPCYLIAQQAAKKAKVILNGTGGDELFGGYHRYNVRSFLPGQWSSKVGNFFSCISENHPWTNKIGALLDYRRRYYRWLSIFTEANVRSALGLNGKGSVNQLIRDLFVECAENDPPGSMMFVDMNLYLPGDLFMMLDKMTMAVSLEGRVPLLDHRLVEFMATLPGSLKMRGKNPKWLLRQALRGKIPDQILDRPKQGFGPPISKWMNGPLGLATLKLLTCRNARLLNLFNKEWIASWIRKGHQLTDVEAGRVWSLLVLELWLRIFIDEMDLSNIGVQELAEGDGLKWI